MQLLTHQFHSIRVIPTPAARELIIPLKNQCGRIQKQQPHLVGKRGKEEKEETMS